MAAARYHEPAGSLPEPVPPAGLVPAAVRHILRALPARQRYKYVTPWVEPEGAGWKVVSPNCSRNVQRDGGDIDIAWLAPGPGFGEWTLHRRDHAAQTWVPVRQAMGLGELLLHLCADPSREFWV